MTIRPDGRSPLRDGGRRTERASRKPNAMRRLFRGRGTGLAARRLVEGLQIGGKLPGRARVADVMLLQKHVERKAEATFGQALRAVVTGHTGFRKQSRARFTLVEVLGSRRFKEPAATESEQDAPARNHSHH